MSAIKGTRHLPDTSLNVVNRTATPATITKNRLVGWGTPTGTERAIESLNVTDVALVAGVISEDVESGKSTTLHGPGSIEAVMSDGSGTISVGDEVIAVAGASLAASGRMKKLPTATGTYYVVGKALSAVAATSDALGLVRLVEPRKIIVA